MTTIVVTGGRAYSDRSVVNATLSTVEAPHLLIHGGASGADTLCKEWAEARGVPTKLFAADWKLHGKSAGPIRNRAMMRYASEQNRALCIIFPGGTGTQHAIRCAQKLRMTIKYAT